MAAVTAAPVLAAHAVLPEFLAPAFMQRALVAAILVGLVAPAIGIYLVQRRLALMGDGIGHVALLGVGLGLLLNTTPVWTAVVVATLGATAVELVRARAATSGDVALALLFYGGIAGGVVLIGLSDSGSPANLQSYLFGSLTTVAPDDLVAIALGVSYAVSGVTFSYYADTASGASIVLLAIGGFALVTLLTAALRRGRAPELEMTEDDVAIGVADAHG